MEGPIAPVECVSNTSGSDYCDNVDSCVAHLIWDQVKENILEVVDSVSLADLCEKARTIEEENDDKGYVFHI